MKLVGRMIPAACVGMAAGCAQPAAPVRGATVDALAPTAEMVAGAERLAEAYRSGAREFPPLAADPRDAVPPETLARMKEGADRLARAYGGGDAR